MQPDQQTMIGLEAGIGFLLSLVAFLRAELSTRWTKDEVLRAIGEGKTIQEYIEWLRRRDHESLIREIESSKGELIRDVAVIGSKLDEFASSVRAKVGDLEQRVHELNERILPPILSPLSLPTRPG